MSREQHFYNRWSFGPEGPAIRADGCVWSIGWHELARLVACLPDSAAPPITMHQLISKGWAVTIGSGEATIFRFEHGALEQLVKESVRPERHAAVMDAALKKWRAQA